MRFTFIQRLSYSSAVATAAALGGTLVGKTICEWSTTGLAGLVDTSTGVTDVTSGERLTTALIMRCWRAPLNPVSC